MLLQGDLCDRAERLEDRTAAKVAIANTSVPTPVANEEIVVQSTAMSSISSKSASNRRGLTVDQVRNVSRRASAKRKPERRHGCRPDEGPEPSEARQAVPRPLGHGVPLDQLT